MQDCGVVRVEGVAVRILQVTDVHHMPSSLRSFRANDGKLIELVKNGYDTSANVQLLETLARETRPDLVVLTGDIIDGRAYSQAGLGRDSYREGFAEYTEPLVRLKIPWTFVPGNHDDDQTPWSREDLLGVLSLPMCVSKLATRFDHMFVLQPKSINTTPSPPPALRLWLFDSGTNSPDPAIRYTTFDPATVSSFRERSQEIARGNLDRKELAIAMFHIPLPEYEMCDPVVGHLGLFDAALVKGVVPFPWNKVPWLVKLLGKHRVCGCSKLNSGIFDAFKIGNVCATFCGHDHYNDAVMMRDDVALCYGRVSSFTPPSNWEGAGGPLPFKRGGRVIEMTNEFADNKWRSTLHTFAVGEDGREEPASRVVIGSSTRSQNSKRSSWLPGMVVLLVSILVWIVLQRK